MTAAWLHAGARSVTSSTNLVADDVACEVLAVAPSVKTAEGGTGRRACGGRPGSRPDEAPSPFLVLRCRLVRPADEQARPGGSAPGERRVAPAGPSVWWQSGGLRLQSGRATGPGPDTDAWIALGHWH